MNASKYFRELTLNLRRAGFTVGTEADNLLPVELDGEHLCAVTEGGSIRYRKEDVASEARTEALDKVIDIAGVTAEYTKQMEAAPILKASGLTGDYQFLVEFNEVVQAGHQTQYSAQFITWERVRELTGLSRLEQQTKIDIEDTAGSASKKGSIRTNAVALAKAMHGQAWLTAH